MLVCPPFNDAVGGGCRSAGQLSAGWPRQNIHWADQGAFTGEISGAMLKECGVTHSSSATGERRQYFGETDATVNQRLKRL